MKDIDTIIPGKLTKVSVRCRHHRQRNCWVFIPHSTWQPVGVSLFFCGQVAHDQSQSSKGTHDSMASSHAFVSKQLRVLDQTAPQNYHFFVQKTVINCRRVHHMQRIGYNAPVSPLQTTHDSKVLLVFNSISCGSLCTHRTSSFFFSPEVDPARRKLQRQILPCDARINEPVSQLPTGAA